MIEKIHGILKLTNGSTHEGSFETTGQTLWKFQLNAGGTTYVNPAHIVEFSPKESAKIAENLHDRWKTAFGEA